MRSYKEAVIDDDMRDSSRMVALQGIPEMTILGGSSGRQAFTRVSKKTLPRKYARTRNFDDSLTFSHARVTGNGVEARGYEPSNVYARRKVTPFLAETRSFPGRKKKFLIKKNGGKSNEGKWPNMKSRNGNFGKSFGLWKLFGNDDDIFDKVPMERKTSKPNANFVNLISEIVTFLQHKKKFGRSRWPTTSRKRCRNGVKFYTTRVDGPVSPSEQLQITGLQFLLKFIMLPIGLIVTEAVKQGVKVPSLVTSLFDFQAKNSSAVPPKTKVDFNRSSSSSVCQSIPFRSRKLPLKQTKNKNCPKRTCSFSHSRHYRGQQRRRKRPLLHELLARRPEDWPTHHVTLNSNPIDRRVECAAVAVVNAQDTATPDEVEALLEGTAAGPPAEVTHDYSFGIPADTPLSARGSYSRLRERVNVMTPGAPAPAFDALPRHDRTPPRLNANAPHDVSTTLPSSMSVQPDTSITSNSKNFLPNLTFPSSIRSSQEGENSNLVSNNNNQSTINNNNDSSVPQQYGQPTPNNLNFSENSHESQNISKVEDSDSIDSAEIEELYNDFEIDKEENLTHDYVRKFWEKVEKRKSRRRKQNESATTINEHDGVYNDSITNDINNYDLDENTRFSSTDSNHIKFSNNDPSTPDQVSSSPNSASSSLFRRIYRLLQAFFGFLLNFLTLILRCLVDILANIIVFLGYMTPKSGLVRDISVWIMSQAVKCMEKLVTFLEKVVE